MKPLISTTTALDPSDTDPASVWNVTGSVCAIAGAILYGFQELVLNPGGVLVGNHRGGQNDLTEWFIRSREFSMTPSGINAGGALWNPYLGLGQPHLGNPQSALYYLPNWLSHSFDVPNTLSWLLVGHHVWAALGCMVLGRFWGLRWASSVLSGIGLGLAPFLIAQTAEGHYAQIAAISWIPWTFVVYEWFRHYGGLTWIAISICFSLSFFAGHAQETFYLIVLLSMVVATEVSGHLWHREFRQGGRLVVDWMLTGIVMLGLVAVDFIPIWSVSRASARLGGLDLASAGVGLGIENLQQLLCPDALGSPATVGDYWETLFHFGTVLTGFAMVGASWKWTHRGARIAIGLLVVSTLFSFGNRTPLFVLCYQAIPGCAAFRLPSRMLFFSSFCMAMLAGFGLDAITRQLRTVASRDRGRRYCRQAATWLTAMTLSIVTGELCQHAHRVLAIIPRHALRENSVVSQFLTRQTDCGRILSDQTVYSDREAVRDRVQRFRAYEPVPLLRYIGIMEALTRMESSPMDLTGYRALQLDSLRKSLLDLAGVHYMITATRQKPPEGWTLVHHGHVRAPVTLDEAQESHLPYWIYQNKSPLPRAFVQGNVKACRDWKQVIRMLPDNDSRGSIIIDEDLLPPGTRSTFVAAKIVEYSPDRVIIDTDCTAAGYAVLTDIYHPGWKARLDGASVPVVPVNLGFRGVPVPAGRHRIVMSYQPPGLHLGMLLTVATIVALLGLRCRSRHQPRVSVI